MPSQPKRKKVGRPKLPKGAAKGKAVQVRFTAEGFKRVSIAATAEKRTVSEWIRSTLEARLNG